jgi:transcriptional antiterminator NusG
MKELRDAFSPEVLAELARPILTYDPGAMQLDGVEPTWGVFELASRKVEAELIKKRFGIYVPECEETIVRRGRKIERRLPLFPGYVFVLMPFTDENWNRIFNIRGVIAGIGSLSWDDVDKVRTLENEKRPINLTYFEDMEIGEAKKKKKRWRKSRRVEKQDEIVRTYIGGWVDFEAAVQTCDGDGRNQALRDFVGGHP